MKRRLHPLDLRIWIEPKHHSRARVKHALVNNPPGGERVWMEADALYVAEQTIRKNLMTMP
jgi:hypothetical protein